jgi:hypothetical protein
MTLADLRRLSIQKQYLIHFRLRNGLECVVSEHGIAQVPELRKVPDFNLEEELAEASEFLIEPAPAAAVRNAPAGADKPRRIGRRELAALVSPSSGTAQPEHEDE